MATIVGMFENSTDVDRAVNDLTRQGFSRNQIGVVARREVLKETGLDLTRTTEVGAIAGATAGGVGGLLLGLGVIAIPGIGPIVAVGEFLTWVGAMMLGAAVGAVGGGLVGALAGFGLPRHRAEYYVEGLKKGNILLTIQSAPETAQEAANIMRRDNAVEVDLGGAELPTGQFATGSEQQPTALPH